MTIQQQINIAKYSQSLAEIAVIKGGLFSGGIDTKLPMKIFLVRKSVEEMYLLNPSDPTLVKTANYMYSLCGQFGLKAASLLTGGGINAPVTPISVPQALDFTVDATTSVILAGAVSAGITAFKGYNVLFIRSGVPQSVNNVGGSYFAWDKVAATLSFTPAATVGEIFQIYPFI